MSVDLDWNKLDASLAASLIDVLNKQLQSAPRPSFIGPVEVASFDFGSQPPDIELIDIRNIHRDFLEDDDEDIAASRAPVHAADGLPEDEGFEWVPRRAAGRAPDEDIPA